MPLEKLIAGIPHVQIPCSSCGELIWTRKNLSAGRRSKQRPNICDTCYPKNKTPSTGGGIRVIRKGYEMGG